MTVLLSTPRTHDGGETLRDARHPGADACRGGGIHAEKANSVVVTKPGSSSPTPVEISSAYSKGQGSPLCEAFSSPSSCASSSTRIPDSDSEEFLLDGKDDAGITSEEEGAGSENAACLVEPDRRVLEGATEAVSARQETIHCRRKPHALSNPRDTNLTWFRHCVEVTFATWVPGDFTTVGRLAKSVHAEVYHHTKKDGTSVVAKVMPTEKVMESRSRLANERSIWLSNAEVTTVEDSLNEIAVLTFLQRASDNSDFVLKLLGVFQDTSNTYLVTEYCEGGELFEAVASGDIIGTKESKRYISQLLLAVQYIHSHNVGHRDISLENVLLRHGRCVLMDFGQAVRLRTIDGTELRYFAEAGKRMYRAPEMYVPREKTIQIICPPDAEPGAVAQVSFDRSRCQVLLPADANPGLPCRAEPYGYAIAPVDLFACGVCAFVLAVGKPPWGVARDTDPTFSFIRRHGVATLLRQWRICLEPVEHEEDSLLAEMLQVCPTSRPSVGECLRHAWLAGSIDQTLHSGPGPVGGA